jgi:hypothetical protein
MGQLCSRSLGLILRSTTTTTHVELSRRVRQWSCLLVRLHCSACTHTEPTYPPNHAPTHAQVARRTLVTQTRKNLGGDGGHHNVFDGKVFKKSTILVGMFFVLGGGMGVPIGAVVFQNKKSGIW